MRRCQESCRFLADSRHECINGTIKICQRRNHDPWSGELLQLLVQDCHTHSLKKKNSYWLMNKVADIRYIYIPEAFLYVVVFVFFFSLHQIFPLWIRVRMSGIKIKEFIHLKSFLEVYKIKKVKNHWPWNLFPIPFSLPELRQGSRSHLFSAKGVEPSWEESY